MASAAPTQASRPFFWVHLALFLTVIFFMSRMGPVGRHLGPFSFLYAASFGLLWLVYKNFPVEWPHKKQLAMIFGIAVLCRIFFVPFPPSDDVNRYIWEGFIFNQGVNPYLHAPEDSIVTALGLTPMAKDIWHNINHKDASAAYPPMMILFFGFLSSVSKSPVFFKTVMTLFDIMLIPVLARMANSRQIKPSMLILYALNPLVIVFIAGEGHLDAVQVFFVCLSLVCFTHGKDGCGFFSLGLAVMSKYFALILLPFLINRKNWKKTVALFIPFIFFLPFLDAGKGLFSSLIAFGTTMHYNDSLAHILRVFFGSSAVLAGTSLLFICLAVIFFLVHDPFRSSYLAIACLLAFAPTIHPWYIVLITPFMVFFPSRAWLFLHFGVIFTFPVLSREFQTDVFQEIHWLKGFEYLPFFGLLVFDFVRRRPVSAQPRYGPVKAFSVVIPTLNEAKNISGAFESLKNETGILEIVVADGGSSDPTREMSKELGAVVVESKKGRGHQIRAGIDPCRGDVILVLHADCRVIPGTFERIKTALNQNSNLMGGSLGMSFPDPSPRNRFLAFLNNWRARWTGISFGDQGQFFRTAALDKINGFPHQMLMEDIELSLRLKEKGALCFLSKGIIVSQRRWDDTGFWPNFKKVIALSSAYLIKRRLGMGDEQRKDFYSRYYGMVQE